MVSKRIKGLIYAPLRPTKRTCGGEIHLKCILTLDVFTDLTILFMQMQLGTLVLGHLTVLGVKMVFSNGHDRM